MISNNLLYLTSGIFLSVPLIYYIFKSKLRKKLAIKPSHAVFITGCDTGLGYSLARFCQKLGLTVLAGCLDATSAGATNLKDFSNVHVIEIDVTNNDSIRKAVGQIISIINEFDLELKTLVNNAGVMVFGEFHWLTVNLIEQQIKVNLVGAMIVTKELASILRVNKGRVINVSSHCALKALPGVSVYTASKAGILAWSDALRLEFQQYGVQVISLFPGSFVEQTNILSKQNLHALEMESNMVSSDYELFSEYFTQFNQYLSHIPTPVSPTSVRSNSFYSNFEDALLSVNPRYHYCDSPFSYKLYHFLFKVTPYPIHDWLIWKFMNMPRYKPNKKTN